MHIWHKESIFALNIDRVMGFIKKENSQLKSADKKAQKGKKSRKSKLVIWIWTCFGSLVGLIYLFFILIYNGVIGYMPSVEDIANPQNKYASFIYSADGVEIGRYYAGSGNRIYSDMSEIPQHMIDALIATEDERFYEHSGIDFKSIFRAIIKTGIMGDATAGGGSTLTQQLAKQIYTEKPATDKLERAMQKPVEWMIALKLERNYSKDEIIKMYLNRFDFLYNAVGVKSAAHVYFGKEPSQLNIEESAMLVGMVKNPSYFNPLRHPERTRERRNMVLHKMALAGILNSTKAEELKQLPLGVTYHRPESHSDGIAQYFREELRRYLTAKEPKRENYQKWEEKQFNADSVAWVNDPLYGWGEKNGYNIYGDGLKIYTTIDTKMQKYAEDAVRNQMKIYQNAFGYTRYKNRYTLYSTYTRLSKEKVDKFINTSIRHSDRYRMGKKAGKSHEEILAEFNVPHEMTMFSYDGPKEMILTPLDSILYRQQILRSGFMAMDVTNGHIKAYVGGIDYEHFRYDMVSIGRKQIGSTAKPYLYSAAIEDLDLDPNDRIKTYSPVWKPRGSGYGAMPLKMALTKSHNGASAGLMYEIGPERMIDQMGAHGLVKENIRVDQTIALGSCEIPLKEMCVGYSPFANQGFSSAAMMVTKITDNSGNIIEQFTPRQQQALSKNGYARMLETLKSVIKNGTGRSMSSLGAEMGGKTGTTDFNADGWFMGFTPKLVFGAWVGGENKFIHLNMIGGRTALPICKQFMTKVYNDKTLPYKKSDKFAEFEDAVVYKKPIYTPKEEAESSTTVEDVYD